MCFFQAINDFLGSGLNFGTPLKFFQVMSRALVVHVLASLRLCLEGGVASTAFFRALTRRHGNRCRTSQANVARRAWLVARRRQSLFELIRKASLGFARARKEPRSFSHLLSFWPVPSALGSCCCRKATMPLKSEKSALAEKYPPRFFGWVLFRQKYVNIICQTGNTTCVVVL